LAREARRPPVASLPKAARRRNGVEARTEAAGFSRPKLPATAPTAFSSDESAPLWQFWREWLAVALIAVSPSRDEGAGRKAARWLIVVQ
jgi:hypothetical protein